jgi:hypothetical protein
MSWSLSKHPIIHQESIMTSPIILGVVAELRNSLSLNRVVAMSVALCESIYNDDGEVDDDMMLYSGLSIGTVREIGDFWNNHGAMNCIVASLLESETQRIANPILAAYEPATAEDRTLVIRATDDVQIEAVKEVTRRCKEMWDVPPAPVVLRDADNSPTGFWGWFTSRFA